MAHYDPSGNTWCESAVNHFCQSWVKPTLKTSFDFLYPYGSRCSQISSDEPSPSHQSRTRTRYGHPFLAGSTHGQFFDPLV
jgi:hypothetical protein